jgi:hypothetical protein
VPFAQTASAVAVVGRPPPPQRLESQQPPRSPRELLERIRQDYIVKNYLWTGDIDMACFDSQCTFTDPTLSFTGTDQFVQNIQNLKPLVDRLLMQNHHQQQPPESDESDDDDNGRSRCSCASSSVLLDIQLMEQEGYIQTRWNMIGDLKLLPWKPRIDVIGRTKFWFVQKSRATTISMSTATPETPLPQGDDDDTNNDAALDSSDVYCYQVIEYDEEWEIPAAKALLQLITPAGTIPNSSSSSTSTSSSTRSPPPKS